MAWRHETLPDMIVINVNCLEPSTMSPTPTRRDKLSDSFHNCHVLWFNPAYQDEQNAVNVFSFEWHSNGFDSILAACWKLVLEMRNGYQHLCSRSSRSSFPFCLLLSSPSWTIPRRRFLFQKRTKNVWTTGFQAAKSQLALVMKILTVAVIHAMLRNDWSHIFQ